MYKKILIPALAIMVLATACNKNFSDVHSVTGIEKEVAFTVSSPVLVRIDLEIMRKIPGGEKVIESFHADNAATPYTFSSIRTQSGDVIGIQITNYTNKPSTASLKIADVNIPVSTEGLVANKSNTIAPHDDNYLQIWSAVIP